MFYYAVDKTLMPKLKSFLLHFCRHSPKADVNCFVSHQLYGTVSWQNRMVCILIPPGDWDMLRFKIHFPSKEILIIFSFIHIIHSFTQEFIAALNRFFCSHNFSSGSCFDFATFLKTAVLVYHLLAMMGFFIPLIRDEEKKYEKFRTYIAILELSTLNCNSFAMSIICAGIWSGFQSTKRTVLYPVTLIAYGLSWSDTEAVSL